MAQITTNLQNCLPSMAMVNVSDLNALTATVKTLIDEVKALRAVVFPSRPYGNKEVKEILGIQDKLLKKYRDEGWLGYHQIGDKYWYTQADLDNFLKVSSVEPIYTAA